MLCSSFADMMENYNQGDLTDIVRAAASAAAAGGGGGGLPLSDDWHQFQPDITVNDFQSSTIDDDFGDPFSNFRHQLFNDHDHLSTTTTTSSTAASFFTSTPGFLGGAGLRPASNNNNNIFSRMLQISPNHNVLSVNSPCESQAAAAAAGLIKVAPPPTSLLAASDVMICSKGGGGGGGGLVENGVGVQISSPRNAGIKRRKSQAKKVVCIPAPTPANSRPSGEVVPSDLWAWRKYGQKPIKGSPYPRGYYRCSSSKGCSARKQVERSRTDPNMLVITYTSEHNHPWPTQRNALAGSTRAQPNKGGSGSKSSNAGSQTHKAKELEEEKEKPNISENPLFDSSLVKEEMDEQMDMDGCGDVFGSDGFDLLSTYKPNCDDLFADLGEIDGDSLGLLFSQGFDQDRGNKGNMLDHFNMFDWTGNNSGNNNNNNNKNSASFQGEEDKGDS